MSNQNADRNDKQYFNLHLEGFANLYDARWIKPKQGQSFQPFLQVRGTYLQGRHDNAQPLFIDFKVTGTAAKQIVEHFMDSISDENQKVSAVVKCGDIRNTAKMHNGEPRVFTSGRMLTIKWLKVNGQQVDLTPFQEGGEEGRVVNLSEHSQKRQEHPERPEQAQRSESLPMRVKLDKEAPDFAQRKAELKAAGYRWDRDNFEWTLAPRERVSA
jgi:hypothetical protein